MRVRPTICLAACVLLAPATFHGSQPPQRTSLSNPQLVYSVPDKPYVVLKRADVEAVVVDNRAVDDGVLPGHRAGYSGIAR